MPARITSDVFGNCPAFAAFFFAFSMFCQFSSVSFTRNGLNVSLNSVVFRPAPLRLPPCLEFFGVFAEDSFDEFFRIVVLPLQAGCVCPSGQRGERDDHGVDIYPASFHVLGIYRPDSVSTSDDLSFLVYVAFLFCSRSERRCRCTQYLKNTILSAGRAVLSVGVRFRASRVRAGLLQDSPLSGWLHSYRYPRATP